MNANDLSIPSKLSRIETKHSFSSREKLARHQPSLGRGPTPTCRGVAPMATFKEMKSGKSGFPFLEEHEHKEHGCKDHNLSLQNLRFHAMNSKSWTWIPILEDLMKTNTIT